MNPHKKQQLKSFDLISAVLLLAVVVGISAVIVSREMRDMNLAVGQDEAENLAFQLIHGGFALPNQEVRSPASISNNNEQPSETLGVFNAIGEIGKDPWGNSFSYRVIRNSTGTPTHVVVWSSGPNGERETDAEALTLGEGVQVADLEFDGDDFGYIQPIQ